MAEPSRPRARRYVTFRLFEEDRDKLRKLAEVNPAATEDRYQALLALVPFVQAVKLDGERHPLRLGIPTELDEAIKAKVAETKRTYIDVLLASVDLYRQGQING